MEDLTNVPGALVNSDYVRADRVVRVPILALRGIVHLLVLHTLLLVILLMIILLIVLYILLVACCLTFFSPEVPSCLLSSTF
jgi:hypothetical protein